MGKRLFEIFDDMNQDDEKNKTAHLAVSGNFISADKVKGGAKISMGVEESYLHDLMNDKVMPILIMVNKQEYNKRKGKV